MQGGIDKGGHYFGPRFVGIVVVRKDLGSGGGISSFPGGVGFTSPSQSAINQLSGVFHTVRGGFDPGDVSVFVTGLLEL